jgi:dihydrofolate reductase
MARIIVTEFVSLDGVMEAPGGGESYKHGGWTFKINRGAEGDKFKLDETLSTEALLLGRKTYEGFAKAWPSMKGEFADVVSSTLRKPSWNNTTVLTGDVVKEVTRVKEQLKGDIVVHGSARLAQTLLEHDLVDELHLMSGKRLFGETSDKKSYRLVESKVVGEGVSILILRPAG